MHRLLSSGREVPPAVQGIELVGRVLGYYRLSAAERVAAVEV